MPFDPVTEPDWANVIALATEAVVAAVVLDDVDAVLEMLFCRGGRPSDGLLYVTSKLKAVVMSDGYSSYPLAYRFAFSAMSSPNLVASAPVIRALARVLS